MIDFIVELKDKYEIVVKTIRCDNAGENMKFEEHAREEGLALTFEYTAPNTPQQNGRCERKLTTLYGRARAMLLMSHIEKPLRSRLWCEAANTATFLDRYLVDSNGNSSIEKFFGKGLKIPKIKLAKYFGQLCIVANHNKIKAKLEDRGKLCYWIGYAEHHAAGTYRMYNPTTKRFIMSRDIVFIEDRKNNTVSPELADFSDSEDSTAECTEELDTTENVQ